MIRPRIGETETIRQGYGSGSGFGYGYAYGGSSVFGVTNDLGNSLGLGFGGGQLGTHHGDGDGRGLWFSS